jgi:hypothetical protein
MANWNHKLCISCNKNVTLTSSVCRLVTATTITKFIISSGDVLFMLLFSTQSVGTEFLKYRGRLHMAGFLSCLVAWQNSVEK